MAALLEVENLRKSFGGLAALDGVSFEVGHGELVGLIGPNGAGKTTLIHCISGVLRPTAGRVRLDGRLISGLAPHAVCRAGVGRTFQVPRPFLSMTVEENLRAVARRRDSEWVRACLQAAGLATKAGVRAKSLTFQERRKLELARALATAPRVLLLDEVAAGLNPAETREMVGTVRRIRERFHVGVVWVEHIMEAIMESADRVVVLDRGRVIAAGKPQEIATDPVVVEAYLGREYVFENERTFERAGP